MAKIKENNDLLRIPPQAIDLEEAVLGGIMIEPGSDIAAIEILKPESFYKETHQKIFTAIEQLSSDHKPIDQLTVVEQLRVNGDLEFVGGAYYVNMLAGKIGSAAHLEYHAKILAEKYIKRQIINIANQMQKKAYDHSVDVADLLNFSEKEIFDLTISNKSNSRSIEQILKDAVGKIEDLSQQKTQFSGVPSGYSDLDRVTAGWQPSDLIIIAARPSMGKTAFILSMARNMACLLYTSPSPRDRTRSRMPSSA